MSTIDPAILAKVRDCYQGEPRNHIAAVMAEFYRDFYREALRAFPDPNGKFKRTEE